MTNPHDAAIDALTDEQIRTYRDTLDLAWDGGLEDYDTCSRALGGSRYSRGLVVALIREASAQVPA